MSARRILPNPDSTFASDALGLAVTILMFVAIERGRFRTTRPKAMLLRR